MKYSEILKRAKEMIHSGHTNFICFAIIDAVGGIGGEYLMTWIESQLEGENSLGGWLIRQGLTVSQEDRKQCRLAWLDRMIIDLEEEGK